MTSLDLLFPSIGAHQGEEEGLVTGTREWKARTTQPGISQTALKNTAPGDING